MSEPALVLRSTPRGAQRWLVLAIALVWNAAVLGLIARSGSLALPLRGCPEWGWPCGSPAGGVFFLAIGTVALYAGLAKAFSTAHLAIEGGRLRVTHRPLPLASTDLALAEVTGITASGHAAVARLANGRTVALCSAGSPEEASAIAASLEARRSGRTMAT